MLSRNWRIMAKKGKKRTLLLGGHMSIVGGLDKAIFRGEEIDCTAIQIFTKSNRQWGAKVLTDEDIKKFKSAWKNSFCVRSIVAHASYLINIGSPNKGTCKKSIESLVVELKRCERLGISYLVLHPGSHLGSGEEECLNRIAKGLDTVFKKVPGKSKILIETMAGQGTGVCYKFEQIGAIFKKIANKNRLGVCFDTCHVFAAGYDFRTKQGYQEVMEEFGRAIGLSKLKVFHINGSKKELGSRVDRHADVAKGKIGTEAFKLIFNDERFFDIPKILETPEGTLESYAKNMRYIRRLLTPETKKALGLE